MSKILATPLARKTAEEKGLDLSLVSGSGEYGAITYDDVMDTNVSAASAKTGVKATPVAKNMADYYGMDIELVDAKGNKVTKADVMAAQAGGSSASAIPAMQAEVTTTKIGGMRKTIADNMMNSLMNSAQFTQMAEIDTTALVKFFTEAKEAYKSFSDSKLTITDIMVKLVSLALKKHPILNQTFDGETITSYPYVNMGLAVALEEGLIVPTLPSTDNASLFEISKMRNDLVGKARNNKLKPAEYTGGTFAISNVGNGPGTYFTPVINPPQVAILGIGRTEDKLYLDGDEVKTKKVTYFSLTMDHRIVDGMEGIKFLSTLEELIAQPMSVLL